MDGMLDDFDRRQRLHNLRKTEWAASRKSSSTKKWQPEIVHDGPLLSNFESTLLLFHGAKVDTVGENEHCVWHHELPSRKKQIRSLCLAKGLIDGTPKAIRIAKKIVHKMKTIGIRRVLPETREWFIKTARRYMTYHYEYLTLLMCVSAAQQLPSHPMHRCSRMDTKQGPMHVVRSFLDYTYLKPGAKRNMLLLLEGAMDDSVWVPCMDMSDDVLLQEYFE
jgi:hypothetical protein